MAVHMVSPFFLLLAIAFDSQLVLGSTSDCKYSSGGKNYDLSPLMKKTYTWTQTVVDTTDNIYTNPAYSNNISMAFSVGVCGNTNPPPEAKCSVSSAPAFMYDTSQKKCYVLGSLNASVFEPNPFQDGIYIDYYDGDAIDHITRYEARVYFVCDKTTEITGPQFEHLKDSYQAHFHVLTSHAC